MEKNFTTRTGLIIGDEGINKLKNSNVIVFGVGGVGSFAAEAIARAGVGNLTIVDFDDVDITNINRQLPALHSTVGKYKVEVMKDRILDINPDINIKAIREVYNKDTSESILCENYDYVVDAIISPPTEGTKDTLPGVTFLPFSIFFFNSLGCSVE